MAQGKLLSIATRAKSRAPMNEVDSIEVSVEAGCANDFRGKPGDRQVTVMAREDWQLACSELGKPLPWTTRRANLLVEGLRLAESIGARMTIGEVILEVTGETDPCGRMDELAAGLFTALKPDWRGGVCCRVVKSGAITAGDPIKFGKDRGGEESGPD